MLSPYMITITVVTGQDHFYILSLDMIMDKCCHRKISLTNAVTGHDYGTKLSLYIIKKQLLSLDVMQSQHVIMDNAVT